MHRLTQINEADFDAERNAIYTAITQENRVFHLHDAATRSATNPKHGWILGPGKILGAVFGLYDEEYGWPCLVQTDAPLEQLRPGSRRHPVMTLSDGSEIISISLDEWQTLQDQDR